MIREQILETPSVILNPYRFGGFVADVRIVDNGDAGWSQTGGWSSYSGEGYGNDIHYCGVGDGSQVATWTFTGCAAGTYRILITWTSAGNRCDDAPASVYDDASLKGTTNLHQYSAPNQYYSDGVWWNSLGDHAIASGTLVVKLTNATSGTFVIADAVRIERLT